MIPIVLNHDYSDVIGSILEENGKLIAVFKKPVSREELFEIFPTAGLRIINETYENLIKEVEIIEFSRTLSSVSRARD